MSLRRKIDSISIRSAGGFTFIENQILRHVISFDSNDLSKISKNLPDEYWEYIESFEQAVTKLALI